MIEVITDSAARLQASSTGVGYRCLLSLSGEIDRDTVAVLETALEAVLLSAERDSDHSTLAVIAPEGPARQAIEASGLGGRLPVFHTRHDAHRGA